MSYNFVFCGQYKAIYIKSFDNIFSVSCKMKCLRIVLQNLRDLVLRFDLFAAAPTFRVRQQPDYETLGCGFLSLVMVLTFAGIFATQIIDVLNKADVTATVNLDDQPDSAEEIFGINFAVGIQKVKFEDIAGYFDIKAKIVQLNQGEANQKQSQIKLEKCTKQIWESYNESIAQYYDPMKINQMYCVPKGENVTLKGYEGSQESTAIQLTVEKCVGKEQCVQDDPIKKMFKDVGYIPVRLLFVNKMISPSNKIPVTATIQKNIFLSFSQDLGSRGQIVLGKYQVETDESIWPFSTLDTETGHYIQDFKTYTVGIEPTGADFDPEGSRNQRYIDLMIRKSTVIYNVERSHDKIDDLLSYIGGLFSLIFFVFFWFFGSFDEYRLELLVAEASFSYDQDGKKVRERDLGYFTYFLYSIYDWLKMIGIKLNWKKMQKIDQAREEANEQLDITYMIRKIRYYDWCLSLLMEKSHRMSSHLIKPVTLEQSIKQRKLHEYYDKVIHNRFTNDELQKAHEILQMNADIKDLPIEHYRKLANNQRDMKTHTFISQKPIGSSKTIIQQNHPHENENQKNDKRCSCSCNCSFGDIIEDRYDSDDEQAEKLLYEEYQNLLADQSEISKQIQNRIPQYLKHRMKKKISNDDKQRLKPLNKLLNVI